MATQVYWIVVTGVNGSGQTTFVNTAAQKTVYRDRRNMGLIPKQNYFEARNAMRIWSARYLATGEEGTPEERDLIDRYHNSLLVGELTVDAGMYVCLYEAPPSSRFDASWRAIDHNLLGMVVLMDSAAPETFKEIPGVVETVRETDIPFVVAANKQDLPGAVPVNDLSLLLNMGEDTPIVPCVATERAAVKGVLLELLHHLRQSHGAESV